MLHTIIDFFGRTLCIIALASSIFIHANQTDQGIITPDTQEEQITTQTEGEPTEIISDQPQIINAIIVRGNKYIESEAIANKVPFRPGDRFDSLKTGDAIRKLYALGYFDQINIMGEPLPDNRMNLYVIVQEGKRIDGFEFVGNDHLGEKAMGYGKHKQSEEGTIRGRINFDEIKILHPKQIQKVIKQLKKLYQEKDYHLVEITPEYKETDDDTVTVILHINEGPRSFIKRVNFKGNHAISSKKLRSIVFTREDWIGGFMDKSGSYQPDAIEMDKHGIQYFYQNNGYLTAKVTHVDAEMDKETKQFFITFTIDEGDFYTIGEVHAPGNELLEEKYLLPSLPIKPGAPYSRDKINKSIEMLRNTWGEFGYIFSDIAPQIVPDEENKTVSITFNSELGNKIFANRISISGNQKTRDKIIRRQILLDEGEMITQRRMNRSKDRIEGLGFFDRKKGVNWKTTRIDENTADLELLLEEVRTGKLGFQLGTGGDPKSIMSPAKGFTFSVFFSDANAFGQGWLYNFGAEIAREAQSFNFNLSDPWLFDRPILGALDLYLNRSNYGEEVQNAAGSVQERVIGGSFSLGVVNTWFGETSILTQIGAQNYDYASQPQANVGLPFDQRQEMQGILDRRFLFGSFGWFTASLGQDVRNHPAHPTKGYQWSLRSKVGISGKESCFGFYKIDFDNVWYTPIIGQDTLILGVHAHLGTIRSIDDRNIPFRELYHIGGPATVRGFTYGEIGPFWRDTSVGGRNAFWINTELMFPVTPDYSTKVAIFYDGGASWSTPDAALLNPRLLINNDFEYRHAVGFSIRMQSPMPISIDWGFKLDKRRGEKTSELAFGAYREF